MVPLKLTRQKLNRAQSYWNRSKDNPQLIRNPPKEFKIGKYKGGVLLDEHKMDLALWVRRREQMNSALGKAEVLKAIATLVKINKGLVVEETIEEEFDIQSSSEYLNIYKGWLLWCKQHLPRDWHIETRLNKPVRVVEASALTPKSVELEQSELKAVLLKHGIMDPVSEVITRPELFWALDEKGFNDERLAGSRCIGIGRK